MTAGGVARRCALLLLAGASAAPPLFGQTEPARAPALAFAVGGAAPVLDVPFVPQSPALCGGAAVAMVLRYYGQRGVYAEDFASLVVATGEGIRTDDLAGAVRQRGWQATPFAGSAELVQRELARGRPIIALIEDRPGRYHYAVVVAWRAGEVVLHDPARGPLRTLTAAAFDRAWQTTGRWAMLVLPATPPAHTETAPDTAAEARSAAVTTSTDRCSVLMDAAVLAARARDFAGAERVLLEAASSCSERALVMTELAAVRFQQRRYDDAVAIAAAVVAQQPERAAAWDLLASSRYLLGDADGALRAWNRIGGPRNDLMQIDGLRATPFHAVSDAVDIAPGEVVSSESIARARRRVSALPTVARARVDYRPLPGGDVEVQAAIIEKAQLPFSLADLLAHGVRALADNRVRLDVANALRAGEAWLLDWVWERNRRNIELGFAAPNAFGAGGVWQLHVADRTLTYRTTTAGSDSGALASVQRETHRAATIAVSDWITSAIQWQLRGSLDGFTGHGSFAGVVAQLQLRGLGDRVALRAGRGGWWSITGDNTFETSSLHAAVRSGSAPARFEWSARTGITFASDSAPRTHWSGAGNQYGADALLRAHPLIDGDGITTSTFFAPRLAHAGLELRQWLRRFGPIQLGAATFIDAARVNRSLNSPAPHTAVDIGAGLRLRLAGLPGTVRADAAVSITDRSSAVSLGWSPPWPSW